MTAFGLARLFFCLPVKTQPSQLLDDEKSFHMMRCVQSCTARVPERQTEKQRKKAKDRALCQEIENAAWETRGHNWLRHTPLGPRFSKKLSDLNSLYLIHTDICLAFWVNTQRSTSQKKKIVHHSVHHMSEAQIASALQWQWQWQNSGSAPVILLEKLYGDFS